MTVGIQSLLALITILQVSLFFKYFIFLLIPKRGRKWGGGGEGGLKRRKEREVPLANE